MNPQERAKQQAEVMLAYANGAEIEWMHTHLQHWSPLPQEPVWNFNSFDYRVKPAHKVVKLEAYRSSLGLLFHVTKDYPYPASQEWKRIPALDLEYVEDES